MTVVELLSELRERGIKLKVEGERLRAVAERGALTPELAERIKEHKAELLSLLANVSSNGASAGVAPIPPAPDRSRYRLSVTQHRAAVSARDGAVVGTCYRMRGPLEIAPLKDTLERIVARHAPLRSAFFLDRSPPEQEVTEGVPVELRHVDLSDLPESEREAKLDALRAGERAWRFDVSQAPLFRFHLVRLAPDHHVLVTAFSPLTWDGWSFDVFWNELRQGYAALAARRAWPFADLPIAYADYVAWQEQSLAARDAALSKFWREHLGDELPPLPLPTDRPRPRLGTHRGDRIKFDLPQATAESVRAFSRRNAATPQIVMLAALYGFLHRASRVSSIVVGCPVEARVHASTEGLIGPFVNMLLLRVSVDGASTFRDFATRVRDECLSAYDHQEYPIERLKVRSRATQAAGLAPAFQVEFSYQQVSQRGSEMGPLHLSQLELGASAATNDVTLWVKDWGDRISGQVEYKADLFERETIAHWFKCYTNFLGALLGNSERPMDELDVFGGEAEVLKQAAKRALANPPEWLLPALAELSPKGEVSLRIIDERGLPGLLGTFGKVELDVAGERRNTVVLARLTADGRLVRHEPGAGNGAARVRPPYEAPRTDLETQLVSLFATLLEEPKVGALDDYFDLGGNSLLAVRLFGEIQNRFGVRLPLTTLLDAGNPRALAEIILKKPARDSCLVKLRPGDARRAVFLVHDGDGETLLYANLARRLPPGTPVYGIEPLRSGPLAMVHTSVEAAARHYVGEMRRVQPEGPYVVGGLCAGGLISYEIARQLRETGQEVGLLALIEAAPPYAKKRASRNELRLRRFSALSELAGTEGLATAARKAAEKTRNFARFELGRVAHELASRTKRFLLRNVYEGGAGWPERMTPPTVREVYAWCERSYEPAPIQGVTLTLYCATSGTGPNQPFHEILEDRLFDWQGLSDRAVVRVDAPGGHSTMLQEPNVEVLARHMSEILAGGDSPSCTSETEEAPSSVAVPKTNDLAANP